MSLSRLVSVVLTLLIVTWITGIVTYSDHVEASPAPQDAPAPQIPPAPQGAPAASDQNQDFQNTDIKLTLTAPAAPLIVGSTWSIKGELHNGSRVPIWIIDRYCIIGFPGEVFARGKTSIRAYFQEPTYSQDDLTRVVRKIDPGISYNFIGSSIRKKI
jgi:hypothetical protein